jgi:hypothetical protein
MADDTNAIPNLRVSIVLEIEGVIMIDPATKRGSLFISAYLWPL